MNQSISNRNNELNQIRYLIARFAAKPIEDIVFNLVEDGRYNKDEIAKIVLKQDPSRVSQYLKAREEKE